MDPKDHSSPVNRETLGQPPGPCAMVIFGAGGDLTKRKLIPAIYNLAQGKLLPEQFAILGSSVEPFTTEEFRKRATADIHEYSTCESQRGVVGLVCKAPLLSSPAISTTRSFIKKSPSSWLS